MNEILIACLVYVFTIYPSIKIIGHIRRGESNGTEIFIVR